MVYNRLVYLASISGSSTMDNLQILCANTKSPEKCCQLKHWLILVPWSFGNPKFVPRRLIGKSCPQQSPGDFFKSYEQPRNLRKCITALGTCYRFLHEFENRCRDGFARNLTVTATVRWFSQSYRPERNLMKSVDSLGTGYYLYHGIDFSRKLARQMISMLK